MGINCNIINLTVKKYRRILLCQLFLAKPNEVERNWYVIDAAGKSLGRVAAQAATLLRGKNKATFTPNVDCGDHVIIINCKDAVLTGNKLTQKKWQRHTGYIGHLKETRYDTLMATKLQRLWSLLLRVCFLKIHSAEQLF